jgi:hypothetical protein
MPSEEDELAAVLVHMQTIVARDEERWRKDA